MIFKTEELQVCSDRMVYLANRDLTGLEYHYTPETAAALAESMAEGERLLTERHGRLHCTLRYTDGRGCDCCGRDLGYTDMSVVEAFTPAVGRKMGDALNSSDGHYVDPRFIISASVQPMGHHKRGLSYTASGYGSKIPTEYVVHCADNRTRRVYAAVFGNSGSLWISCKGGRLWLDSDAETKLEKARA